MPPLSKDAQLKQHIANFEYPRLFINELGWDRPQGRPIDIEVDDVIYELVPVAGKRFLKVFQCISTSIPPRAIQKKIHTKLRRYSHENFIIFTDRARTDQEWFFVWKDPGKTIRAHVFKANADLRQRLLEIGVSLEEEEHLSPLEVLSRVRSAFDVDRVTKAFYDRFKTEHTALLKFIEGIPDSDMKAWYASVTLNRLMFIYFIQKKGFLNNDTNYLRARLEAARPVQKDRYYRDFLCPLFFEGFALKPEERSPQARILLGNVPYLNGGIFQQHQVEQLYGEQIHIPDKAFQRLFDFFDQYRWHLDDRPSGDENEINPDVLGYIFEKYINQKQMGAYYTKEDITGYISRNTIIPWLFDRAKKYCRIAFEGESSLWDLLKKEPDRYIYPAVRKGCDRELPENIAAGIHDVSARGDWNTPADEDFALPTEIWRETVARRQRYAEVKGKLERGEIRDINDLITYNLDIEQFAQDVIQNAEGPELVRAFWKALNEIRVLDPTVGSGAFLFAAMNILEPLYEDCLDQMEGYIAGLPPADSSGKFSDFKKELDRCRQHSNASYFIYKSITINNLYGVDIMEEAVETCKLRLFLKLVSQVDRQSALEPLPDIDFNIRAGNTLVGFTSFDEIHKVMMQEGKDQQMDWMKKLELEQQYESINEQAKLASMAFQAFQYMQTEQGMDAADFRAAKQDLQARLAALNEELNRALALSYGVKPEEKAAYNRWLKSHLPFHWCVDFYEIIQSGGFDVIIGNPPYVEYSKVRKEYTILNYETESCGNLYAYVLERSIKIKCTEGTYGLIVPISLMATERMKPLQDYLLIKGKTWLSSFDVYPSKLFEGAKQRLTIIINHHGQPSQYTTRYYRWFPSERQYLLANISYTESLSHQEISTIPKIGNVVANRIYKKIYKHLPANIKNKTTAPSFYVHRIPFNYIKAIDFIPYFWNEKDGQKKSEDYKPYKADQHKSTLLAIINSNLFFWRWYLEFEGYHCGKHEILTFPFGIEKIDNADHIKLHNIVNSLMEDIQRNSEIREAKYKTTGLVKYQAFSPRKSKQIIDEIDRVLAEHYGFSDEELDFIINYDIKYRMGDELNSEEDEEPESENPGEADEDDVSPAASAGPPSEPAPPPAPAKETVAMELPLEMEEYYLCRCLACNAMVLSFERQQHTAEQHGGVNPGYERLGG